MRYVCLLLTLVSVLCACSAQKEFETLSDQIQYQEPIPSEVILELPKDIAVSVFSDDNGNMLYISDDYTVETYLMPSGNMDKTILEVTGFHKEDMRIVETETDGVKRYECVWSSVGEGALQNCRTTILDDGDFHYVLTVIGDQSAASKYSDEWLQIFKSYRLNDTD